MIQNVKNLHQIYNSQYLQIPDHLQPKGIIWMDLLKNNVKCIKDTIWKCNITNQKTIEKTATMKKKKEMVQSSKRYITCSPAHIRKKLL